MTTNLENKIIESINQLEEKKLELTKEFKESVSKISDDWHSTHVAIDRAHSFITRIETIEKQIEMYKFSLTVLK